MKGKKNTGNGKKKNNKAKAAEARQRAIIDAIDGWADENEYHITLLGTSKDRHLYADAIVGTVETPYPAVVYLRSKVIRAIQKMGCGSYESAEEFYDYNTVRALPYIPEKEGRPVLVDDVIW